MFKGYSEQTLDEYYVDFDTKNTSFIKTALILQGKGVDNCYFFLKLYNKKLRDVDPYSKKLTVEEQAMIFRECAQNRWYFYREVFRVGSEGSNTDIGGGIPFGLHRGNLAYLWANELNLSTYMILPRQFGKTWAAIADCVYTHQFNKNTSIIHFNKSQSDSNGNVYRIRQAIGMLPDYLQHSNEDNLSARDKRKVKNNEKSMRNILDSSITAMASASNEAKADSAARGKTAAKIWFDEFGFLFFNKAIYEATSPVFDKASRSAKEAGIPYGISITTTPGDLVTPHGEFAYKFMQNCVQFDEEMYDYKLKKVYREVLNAPHKRPFIFIQYQYWQLGQDDVWFQEVYKNLGDPLRVRREYLLEWINTNAMSPFDSDDVEVILDLAKSKTDGSETITINKYFKMTVYEEYRGRKPVIISVDVAAGLGRDSSAVVVINPETLRPISIFRSNMVTSVHLKRFLVKLITKHYMNSILTIENNSIGNMLIQELRETPIARNLYKERKKRTIDMGINKFNKNKSANVVVYGHNTNADSRAKMMEILESMVRYNKSHLGYPEIAEELNFLELRSGKITHSSATHDDTIMAYMGGLYVIKFGTGLKGRGVYFNLADNDEDEDGENLDYNGVLKIVDKYLNGKRAAADEYLEYLSTEQDIEDSNTMKQKETEEYYALLDKMDDIDDEDSGTLNSLTESTKQMLLNNISILSGQNMDDDFLNNYVFSSPYDTL